MENDKTNSQDPIEQQLKYLQLLSNQFPTIAAASTEIINLEAILNLPKDGDGPVEEEPHKRELNRKAHAPCPKRPRQLGRA